MPKDRMPRVEELIKREILLILQKDLFVPDLGFFTLTRVHVSKDLQEATVSVSVFDSKVVQDKTLKELNKAGRSIKRILKPRLHMKFIPNISFILDHSAEYSDHISRRLMEIKRLDEEGKNKKPS